MTGRLVQRFKEKAESLSAEVFLVRNRVKVGNMVKKIIREAGSQVVGVVDSPLITETDLIKTVKKTGAIVYYNDLLDHFEEINIGVSEMDLGIAETGTLVQDATDLKKRLVSMLPEIHIVLIDAQNIVQGIENVLDSYYKKRTPPGYIAFVSGPSRTADIERALTIGVHGPGRLIIIVVDRTGEGKNRDR